MKTVNEENHFVLFSDNTIFNLLDPLVFCGSVMETLDVLKQQHGDPIKVGDSPFKIFELILGLRKDNAQFVQIGETNWNNLWLIRQDFCYYLAFVHINGEKTMVARSSCGIIWTFNVISA